MVSGGGGGLLKTRQTTCYHVSDDGDWESGLPASYTVMTTGQFAGTTAIDVPHYACATLTFAAIDKSITDAGAGLVTFLSADTIRVRGSAANDGVYTIAAGTGGVAGHFHVNEALVNEAAGAYVTMCKRSTPANACVIDNVTGLMWKRTYTGTVGSVEKVGPISNGCLNWYDGATSFTLHPAAGDLQMMVTGIKIVGGAAELSRYFVGMIIVCSGFANAVNNLPGYRVTSVAVNGADLDVLLWTGKNTLIAEAAAGGRDIKVICSSIFGYSAAANAIGYAGFTDWRIPNFTEYNSLTDNETPTPVPDAIVFPGWGADIIWTGSVAPAVLARAIYYVFDVPSIYMALKTDVDKFCGMVRG
jgi:hypothetical protein